MPRENFTAKARRLLAEGRVIVTHVDGRNVSALVRGDSAELYRVTHSSGTWSCDCAALGRCSHVQALMLITLPVSVVVVDSELPTTPYCPAFGPTPRGPRDGTSARAGDHPGSGRH